MRKPIFSTRSRRVFAGVAAGALVAAGLGLAATPAYAAVNVVATPTSGPNGGGNAIAVVGTGLFTNLMTAPGAAFNLSACPATYAGIGNLPATVTKGTTTATSTTTANITVPSTVVVTSGATTAYNICLYSAITGTTTLLNNTTIYTATAATVTVAPASGMSGGGSAITATWASDFIPASITTPGATFSVAACPLTYTTSGSNRAAVTVVRTSASIATVTVPATVTTLGTPTAFNVCVYNGTAGTSVLLGQGSPYTVSLPTFTVAPGSGANGGGNTITATATAPFLAGVTTPYVRFTTDAACPDDYGSPTANAVVATKTGSADTTATIQVPPAVLANTADPTVYKVCFFAGNLTTDDLIAAGATYSVSLPTATLSSNIVGSGAADSLTVTSLSPILSGIASPYVSINPAACSPTYIIANGTTTFAGVPRRLTNYKLAITMPADVTTLAGGVDGAYNVCVYGGTLSTSKLVAAPGVFRAVTAPTLAATPISPASGPALGKTPIVITGANFPVAGTITATLGGLPLNDVVRVNDTTLTANTPPHAAETNLTLVVTTSNGSVTKTNAFSYTYGIIVSPNTGDNNVGARIDVNIQGVGFESLVFTDTTGNLSDQAGAHVYLVDGVYTGVDLVDNATGVSTPDLKKDNPPLAECTDVLVISDEELVCTLELFDHSLTDGGMDSGIPVTDGAYTLTVVNKGAANASGVTRSNISSGSTFTVADY